MPGSAAKTDSRTRLRAWLSISAAFSISWLSGCAAHKPPADLVRGEKLLDRGKAAAALPLFDKVLLTHCKGGREQVADRVLRKICGPAALDRAEALEQLNQFEEAIAAYDLAGALMTWRGRIAARALIRKAHIFDHDLARPSDATKLRYQVIRLFPESAAADQALFEIVRRERDSDPMGLLERLDALALELKNSEIEDNLRFEAARLLEVHRPSAPDYAIARYDGIATELERSPLRDDAYWAEILLLRKLGRFADAIAKIEQFLSTKRRAYIVGTYNSEFYDDAMELAGDIARDDLRNSALALRWYRRLQTSDIDSPRKRRAQIKITETQAGMMKEP